MYKIFNFHIAYYSNSAAHMICNDFMEQNKCHFYHNNLKDLKKNIFLIEHIAFHL